VFTRRVRCALDSPLDAPSMSNFGASRSDDDAGRFAPVRTRNDPFRGPTGHVYVLFGAVPQTLRVTKNEKKKMKKKVSNLGVK